MELYEKIQKIRKENNLTQEQFAEKIYVSRTAVSKWETGRGTPSLDSLQMISKEFNVCIDDLLSSDQIIDFAKQENAEKINKFKLSFDSFINLGALLAIVLPLYKTETDGIYYSIYLSHLGGWQGIAFWLAPILMAIGGAFMLVFNQFEKPKLAEIMQISSLIVNISAIALLVVTQQPYPALFFFFIFVIKSLGMIKWRQ